MALLVAPLGYDNDVLSAINDRETAYQLALDVKAAGYIGSIDIKESPYSHVLSNKSVIGMIPSIEYGNNLEEMTIRFKIVDEYTANGLGTYTAINSELSGIKRLAKSATGVIEYSDDVDSFIGHKTLIKISSWGLEIYIDWEEYSQKRENKFYCSMLYIEK